ncbi:MAG: peptidylprolyl isomerase [Carboxydocellales bacterium]
MNKWRKATVFIMAIVMAASFAGCTKKPGSEAVATVNGEEITRAQLDKRVNKMVEVYKGQGLDFNSEQGKGMKTALERQLLDGMVEEKLLLMEAEKQGALPSAADIKTKVEETKKKFDTEEKFLAALKTYNMDVQEFSDWTKQNIALDALFNKVTKDVKVSDADIKKYYDENKETFKQPEKLRARHILIKFDTDKEKVGRTPEQAKKLALDILAQLNKGEDFAKLAQEKTEDPGSKDKGGEYTFGRGEMVKEFEDAAFALQSGQITKEPVKTVYGYHIIKTEEKIPAKDKTFDEVKGELQSSLPLQKKQEAFAKFSSDLKSKAKIDIKLPAPPAPAPSTGTTEKDGTTGTLPAGHP